MNDKQIANLRADLLQKIRASGADVEEIRQALTELAGDVETCSHRADIAPEFSELENYEAGNLVYNEGALYRFTLDHDAGTWTGEDAALTDIATLWDDLTGDISDLQPVDTVTDGSMKPVTSNAVADALKQETVTVTKESGDTYATMISRLFSLIDFSKIKATTKLVRGVRVFYLVGWTSSICTFNTNIISNASSNYAEFITLTISETPYYGSLSIATVSPAVLQMHDYTNESAPDAITIYY